MELKGQVAIVTGGAQGIGRGIALELASLGADVVIGDLNVEKAERTAEEVRALGGRSFGIRMDVTSREEVAATVERTIAELGRIDILASNAGINRGAPLLEITDELWDATMNVNARGLLYCAQAVIPHMLEAGRGNIVATSSQSGKISSGRGLVYGASKAAVISMTRSLALAFAGDGIRVNCVCPGSVDTPMWDALDHEMGVLKLGLAPGEYKRQRTSDIPLGRMATAEDIGRVVGFLVSEKASYMTGQAINVTGGRVMF
jgi:NAD(P)-dependent dehydrogenase (short-subunit alcohol dehydrogenase family)